MIDTEKVDKFIEWASTNGQEILRPMIAAAATKDIDTVNKLRDAPFKAFRDELSKLVTLWAADWGCRLDE